MYWTDLTSKLDAAEPCDHGALCETVFSWAKQICNDGDTRKKYGIYYRDEYLRDLFIRTILFFYSYLKKQSDDMKWVNKAFLYLLDIKLRPFLEDDNASCPRNWKLDPYPDGRNYDSLLTEMVRDQLILGEDGWKCISHYSFYDDFCNPFRQLEITEANGIKDITDAFSESLGAISDVSPAEVMTFYRTTPLSRMVSLTTFNEIMREKYKEAWDINGVLSNAGLLLEGVIEQDDAEPYRIKSGEEPPEGEIIAARKHGDIFIKYHDKYYLSGDFSSLDDMDEPGNIREYTWDELDICNLSIPAGEIIRIQSRSLLIGSDPQETGSVCFRLENEFYQSNVGSSSMISAEDYVFSVDSVDFGSDGVLLTGNIQQKMDVSIKNSEFRRENIRDLETIYDAQGDEEFSSDEHIRRSLRQFVKSFRNSKINEDDEALAECKRLAVVIGNAYKYNKNLPALIDAVIGNAYKYNKNLPVLIDAEKGFEIDEEIFMFFRECLYEYFDRNFIYRECDKPARDALILQVRLYEFLSYKDRGRDDYSLLDEIDNTIFNHERDELFFASESEWMRQTKVYEALDTEKFWYLSFKYLRRHSTVTEQAVYYAHTLSAYWDAIKFKMFYNLTDRSKEYISKIIKWGLTKGHDEEPIVPLVVMTLKRDQLREVINLSFGDSSDISLSEVMDSVILPKAELRWRELYFRLRMLKCRSAEEIIDTFILLVHELGIKDCYISSLVLTLYQDIVEMEKNSGRTGMLKTFLESMAVEYPFINDLSIDSESDLFGVLENKGDSAYTVRRKELVRYLLTTYAADGLRMLQSFSKTDPLAGRRFCLDQAQRIGTFRIIQANSERDLLELFGGAYNSPKRACAIPDDKEDDVLGINPLFKDAVIDAHSKGYEATELFDIFFDTCLSSYIRLDIFNELMGEKYGKEWDINKEIERVKIFRITGLINDLNDVDTSVTNPWEPEPVIELLSEYNMLRKSHVLSNSNRPEKAFADHNDVNGSVLYIHDPSIRVLNDIIRLELDSDINRDDHERFIGHNMTIRIDKLYVNDNGEVVAAGMPE